MRLAARLGNRRTGPGPEPLPRPLEFPDLDFLLFFMISSRLMSKGAAMVEGKLDENSEGSNRKEKTKKKKGS